MKGGIRAYIPIVFLAMAVIICGTLLILVSQKVYHKQNNVQTLSKQILTAEWEIRSMQAELAYLTRPDRLEQLSVAMAQSGSTGGKGSRVGIVPADFMLPDADLSVTPSRKPEYFRQVSTAARTLQPAVAQPKREPQSVQKREKPKRDFSTLLDDIGGN